MLSMTDPAVMPAEATAYLSAAGVTGWPDAESEQAAALMRGQRYLAARYNGRWMPDFAEDEVPDAVRWAICEAALVEAKSTGSLNPTSTPATDKVLVEVKGIVWERVKGAGGADSYIPRIAAVEGLLRGLARSGATGWVVRA